MKDLWFKAEEIVSKVDVADFVVKVGWFILFVFKTIIMFIACVGVFAVLLICLLYTSPSPRDATLSRMPSSA